MAGYSATPLPKKLGIGDATVVVVLDGPPGFLDDLPVGVARTWTEEADVVVAFFTARAALSDAIARLGAMVFPSGAVWVAWPKRASGVETDITEDVVREVALPLGLVDNKVCAIDDTWSALRVVWRRERRR